MVLLMDIDDTTHRSDEKRARSKEYRHKGQALSERSQIVLGFTLDDRRHFDFSEATNIYVHGIISLPHS